MVLGFSSVAVLFRSKSRRISGATVFLVVSDWLVGNQEMEGVSDDYKYQGRICL